MPGCWPTRTGKQTLALHRNAQRFLRPLLVANPFAESLTFLDDKTRTRRDHVKYLTLIRAVALLHQYQRPVKTTVHQRRRRGVHRSHIGRHRRGEPAGLRSAGASVDELPPQTRRLLSLVDEMVTTACQQQGIDRADYRFSRRDIREFTGWGHTQLKVHLKRLEEMEYLLIHRGGRGQSFVYELLYDSPADAKDKFRPADRRGAVEAEYDANWSGVQRPEVGPRSGPSRRQVGPKSGAGKSAQVPMGQAAHRASEPKVNQNANLDRETHRIVVGDANMAKRTQTLQPIGDPSDPQGMVAMMEQFFEWMRVKNYSERTIEVRRRVHLRYFIDWCGGPWHQPASRSHQADHRTLPAVHVPLPQDQRRAAGLPQPDARLVALRAWFKWMARNNHILYNPASDIDLPRLEHRLPRCVLTASEAEQVINQANVTQPLGIRDRAILETFYSAGSAAWK